MKSPNKGPAAAGPAEEVEGRGLPKGNSAKRPSFRTLGRGELPMALARVRQAARGSRGERFTALFHHVYNPWQLLEAYRRLERKAAAGVDGETWQSYAENWRENLEDLAARLQRGAYRAKPVVRKHISKGDGRMRPLGIPALEDKIVQAATVRVLNAIYEEDFVGFSYGCRPGRSQHNALDALSVGLVRKKVNWVLDADIRGFFDAIDHECLIRFIEHRIGDRRVVRHVKKWLNAGVLEKGSWRRQEKGTPQGASISPLLANIYLHYVLDLWVEQWRKRHARGDVIIVRYVDDFVMGFEHRWEAEQFRKELEQRLRSFSLELHPDKTRLIEFGRFAAERRKKRGDGEPETFDFLGLKHICGTTKEGKFTVRRKTVRKRLMHKLVALRIELRRRRHDKVSEVGEWLGAVLRGHYGYYGVPYNYRQLNSLYKQVTWLWYRELRRRSQRSRLTWDRMSRLVDRWLPPPRIVHPYPWERLRVTT